MSNCNLKEILPTAFVNMENVIYINLAENKLTTLPKNVFRNNTFIEELNLSFNSIDFLPADIFSGMVNLAILNLNYNEFSSAPNFFAPDLQRLYFAYNKIRVIDNFMFKSFKNLIHLDLHGNGVQKIQINVFSELGDLKEIDLSFNDLTNIKPTIFLANDKLDSVKLNDNPRLNKLPIDGFLSFSNLARSLYHFDVSNCDISEISEGTFISIPALITLNLSGNNLRVIHKNVFTYLSKLVDLDLSCNAIEFIDNAAFSNNINLRKLQLAYNRLETLPTKIFRKMKNLNELDVSGNRLVQIWAESSPNSRVALDLKNLAYLNVSFNVIQTVYLTDIQVLPNIAVLDIKNNPLECSTHFQQVLKYVGKNNITASDPFRGRPFASLSLNNDAYFVRDPDAKWEELAKDVCVPMPYDNDDDDDNDSVSNEQDNIAPTIKVPTKPQIDSKNNVDEGDDSSESESEEDDSNDIREKEILIGREIDYVQRMGERILYGGGSSRQEARGHYIWPIVIIISTVIAVLLIVARVIAIITHRRGERYRQALLHSKNSIIYQKLTEDFPTQMPKVHKYMPVQQV